MRELKFRLVHDGKIVGYEKWYYDAQNQETDRWSTQRQWLYSADGEDWMPGHIRHDSKDQFAGLKDKNGGEIFARDIVKFNWSADSGYEPNGTEMIDEVVFRDGCFYFVNRETDGGAYAFRHAPHCEVIGNIHENPELLENQ